MEKITDWADFMEQAWTPQALKIIKYFEKEYLMAEKKALKWGGKHQQPTVKALSESAITDRVHTLIMESDFGALCLQYRREQENPKVQKGARLERLRRAIRAQSTARFEAFSQKPYINDTTLGEIDGLMGLSARDRKLREAILTYAQGIGAKPGWDRITQYFEKEYFMAAKKALVWGRRHKKTVVPVLSNPNLKAWAHTTVVQADFKALRIQYHKEQKNPKFQKGARLNRLVMAIRDQNAKRASFLEAHPTNQGGCRVLPYLQNLFRKKEQIR